MKTSIVGFPGLGIENFKLKNVAFEIFGREVMWYGIIITLGIISAFFYASYRAKHNENIKTDDVLDYAIFLVLFGVIGARLYYVFTKFDSYKGENLKETLYNIVAVWEGGIAIYGAIIAGFIALVIVSLVKKIKLGKALDMIAPGVMLGQLIGRWGNFFNGEAYGWSAGVEKLPWRMYLDGAYYEKIVNGKIEKVFVDFVHPTFLYESLWNLVGFIIINLVYKKKKFDGQIFFMYISWYGFGRMFIEGLRTDSLYLGDFRISQLVGFFCFFFGFAFLVSMLIVTALRNRDMRKNAPVLEAVTVQGEQVKATEEETKTTEAKEDEAHSSNEANAEEGGFDISAAHAEEDNE